MCATQYKHRRLHVNYSYYVPLQQQNNVDGNNNEAYLTSMRGLWYKCTLLSSPKGNMYNIIIEYFVMQRTTCGKEDNMHSMKHNVPRMEPLPKTIIGGLYYY